MPYLSIAPLICTGAGRALSGQPSPLAIESGFLGVEYGQSGRAQSHFLEALRSARNLVHQTIVKAVSSAGPSRALPRFDPVRQSRAPSLMASLTWRYPGLVLARVSVREMFPRC